MLVVGEAASGKSTFARLFLMQCIQQQAASQLVPFLITTIDLVRIIKQNRTLPLPLPLPLTLPLTPTPTQVRIIKQNALGADYLDGYLRCIYGPNSRRYLFLKQAMMERLGLGLGIGS